MAELDLVLVVLPQDLTPQGNARATIFLAPRVTNAATVADVELFADWPAVAAGLSVVLRREDGGEVEVRPSWGTLPDSDLWRAYIAPLPVDDYESPDFAQTEIRSYPAQSVAALAEGLYHAVAAETGGERPRPDGGEDVTRLGYMVSEIAGPDRLPEVTDVEAPERFDVGGRVVRRQWEAAEELRADRSRRINQELARRRDDRRNALGGNPAATTRVDPTAALQDHWTAAMDLLEAERFFDRPEARQPQPPMPVAPGDVDELPRPSNDKAGFHSVLGVLGDHPHLLERLGLLIPVEFDAGFLTGYERLQADLRHEQAAVPSRQLAQPWTTYTVDDRHFQPASQTGDLINGMLPLDDPDRFDVAQVDLDSTALLLVQRIAHTKAVAEVTEAGDTSADLPALRSGGITITRLGRALLLEQRIAGGSATRAGLSQAAQDVHLYAEDLVRGYRADVHDGTDWRSLMDRHVDYVDRVSGDVQATVTDEGYVKAGGVAQSPTVPNGPAYLHESLLGWDGWSLVVPRPGAHLPTQPGAENVETGRGEEFDGDLGLHFHTSLVAGKLPRLRYGNRYRLAVRTVDLAGWSTSVRDEARAAEVPMFRRFQPVAHPAVVLRHAVTEGESVARLVIRSGVDGDPDDAAATLAPVDPSTYQAALNAETPRVHGTYRDTSERHLVPPKVGQYDTELLGHYDADGIGQGNPTANRRAAYARARREKGSLLDAVVLSSSDPDAVGTPTGVALAPPLARDDVTAAELADGLERLRNPEQADNVEDLAGFQVLHPAGSIDVPYLPDPLSTGIGLRFTGHGTAEGWSQDVTVAFAGSWPDTGTYRLVLAGGPAGVTVAGSVVTVNLPPGASASVRSSSTIDEGGLDLLGLWNWISDTVPAAQVPDVLAGRHQMITPREELELVHAVQRPLVRPALDRRFKADRGYGETHTLFKGAIGVQSATTGRLDVDATWREWFDEPASGRPPELIGGHAGHAFDLPVALGTESVGLAGNPDLRHHFGDTIHRVVTYAPKASTRFREYLPPARAGNPAALHVTGPGSTIHVPASARAAAPHVFAVMPTFRWVDEPADEFDPLSRSRRRMTGLRVWLERPWHLSGEGEMLGVVVSGEDGILGDSDLRRQFVSLWGKDPIRRTGELPAPMPRPRDFSGVGLLVRDRLTLAEFGGQRPGVSVVGHPVTYSPERDMWFADLDVDPGEASWPFLRLALTRFQPWAVQDAELSPVAIVDFVQLINDRAASVTRPGPNAVTVTVSGIADRLRAPGIYPPGTIEFPLLTPDGLERGARAWIEKRAPFTGDLAWVRVGHVTELNRNDEDQVARSWSGTVELPEPVEPNRPGDDPDGGASEYRVVVAEWESLLADDVTEGDRRIERLTYVDRFGL